MIDNIGPIFAKYLISYCGDVQAVFEATEKQLATIPNIGPATINKIKNAEVFDKADQQLAFLEKNGMKAYTYLDDEYPRRLKHFETSPIVLYFNGNGNLNHSRTVAIIGTRKVTDRGAIICKKIVEGLKPYNVQIISGLAYGVDSLAHKYAVEENISTIGVLGHGQDLIYPASNRALAKRMLENGGTITEFPIESRLNREHFPMRNRIIAAMSDAVIVVESAKKGGSIITAEFANQFNKDVFAVPGRTNDEYSEGCNRLIKQHKANLLESAEDIAYIMRWEEIDKSKDIQTSLFVELEPEEQKIVNILKSNPEINIDELNYKLELQASQLAALLISMEFKGVIKSLPGKKYIVV